MFIVGSFLPGCSGGVSTSSEAFGSAASLASWGISFVVIDSIALLDLGITPGTSADVDRMRSGTRNAADLS